MTVASVRFFKSEAYNGGDYVFGARISYEPVWKETDLDGFYVLGGFLYVELQIRRDNQAILCKFEAGILEYLQWVFLKTFADNARKWFFQFAEAHAWSVVTHKKYVYHVFLWTLRYWQIEQGNVNC